MNQLLDAIAALLVVFDDADLLYTSPLLQATLGHIPGSLYDLVDSADHAFINSGEYRQQPQNQLLYFHKQDRSRLPVSLSIKPVQYEGKAAWLGTAVDISAQWRLEQELRETHDQYRTFIELMSSDTYVISVEKNRHSQLNSASERTFTRITGYTWSEMAELSAAEREKQLYPEDAPLIRRHAELMWQGEVINGVYRLHTRNGEHRWIYIRRLPVYDNQGKVVKYFSVVQDITERKQAEEALRQSEERYRITSELISDYAFAFHVEADGTLVREWVTRESFQRMTGYTPEETDLLEPLVIYHPDDRVQVQRDLDTSIRGATINSEYRLLTRDGRIRHIYLRRQPVWDETHQHVIRIYAAAEDITERKQAEERLRQSEERYRIISDLISDYAFSFKFEPDGSLTPEWTTVNSFQRITGYAPEEVDALGSQALYHPDERAQVQQDMEATMAGRAVSGEYRIVTRQGEIRYIHLYRQPIRDEQDRIVRFYGVAQDITERKITEAALRQSEERYRAISELISDYAYCMRVEPDGTQKLEWMTFDSFQRMTGYAQENVTLLESLALFHVDDREPTRQAIQAVLRGETVQGEYRIITRNGEERFIRFHRLPIRDEHEQRVTRYYGVAQDITEQKLAEKALQDSEQRYRILAHNFPNGMVALFDHDLRYTLIDGAGLTLAGITPDDIIGKTLAEVYPPEIAARDEPYLRAALAGKPSVVEVPFGEMVFEVHTLPLKNDTGKIIGGMVITQNITERRKVEEALRVQTELQILLQKEQDLSQLKNRLMGLITHEFRTPLAVISNSLGMLERHMDTMAPEKRQARVRQIYRQIDHLTEMLDDMAVVVRGEVSGISFKPSRIEAVTLCRETVKSIGSTLGAEHQLTFSTDLDRLHLYADGRLIQRILRNLLSNAIKYSPPATPIEVTLTQKDDRLELSVADQGKGIPLEEQPHIFEPFYRSESIQTIPGLGLGLGIVKDAVELHMGSIEVQSTPDSGTCFVVRLPVTAFQ